MNTVKEPSNSNKGFSLFLTLIIIIIISSLITTFLLTSKMEVWRFDRRKNQEQAFYIASSGMSKVTQNSPSSEYEASDSLFGGYLSTEVKLKNGFFSIKTTGAIKKSEVVMLSEFGSDFDSSVYKNNAILEVNKEPEIYGWIDGEVKIGSPLPDLNLSVIKNEISSFTAHLQSPYQADTELFYPQIFYEPGDIPNKEVIYVNDAIFFRDGTFEYPKTIISTSDIIIESGTLKDLILIAYGEVRIQYDSRLKNVTIFSPNSVILSGYSYFSGEILSQKEIRVAEYATVAESSVLIAEGETNRIRFTESSSFSGTAISTAKKTIAGAYKNIITIEDNAECQGLIYSSGRVSIKNTFQGLVCAHSFYGKSSGGYYGNVIEGDIESGIPESMVVSAYIKTNKLKRKTWKLIENSP